MKFLRFLLIASSVLLTQACATSQNEVPTERLDDSPTIVRHVGEITNIREVKKDASLSKQFGGSFLGALVGGQIGGGSASAMVGTAGAFIGQDIANEKYGEVVDRLILTDSNGSEYECLVHGHEFSVGDNVVFTIVGDNITSIIKASP